MRRVLCVVLFVVGLLGCSVAATGPGMARYDDFKVYKIYIKDEQQLSQLKKFKDILPIRYLNEITSANQNYDVTIDPVNQAKLEEQMKYYQMEYRVTIEDLQSVIEDSLPKARSTGMTWDSFHNLDDIYNFVDNLTMSFPNLITPFTFGYSYEGRPMKAVKISYKPNNKAIFIESQMHAIEWISSATSTCFFNKLLNSQDENMRQLLMNYDWIYVPIMNPDGFVYTHTVERLWRKNRKPTGFSNSSGICYGTDLNRNFGYEWGALSAWNFNEPCDHWYGGAKPDSEPEVLNLQAFINSFPEDYIRMYVPLHSYGNLILLPYGHTSDIFPPNYDQMMRIAKAFADAAKVKYGTVFKYGSTGTINLSGYVSGASKDWAYGVKKIPYTGTIELRDYGEYGFFLPPNQIKEVCEEVTDGIIAMVAAAEKEELFRNSGPKNITSIVNVMMLLCLLKFLTKFLLK
ncbi:zinc carboxypeptidase-like [Musca autumnalis]|uniref:zinc carboxypeptidase-like n=1 Tax=Musca autumnalis TaxID=221902 RepID=UPI003CE9E6CC